MMKTRGTSNSPKTDKETLVRDVASLYNTYVAKGVRIDSFVKKANPSLDIEGLDELLDLYFVLTEDQIRTSRGKPLPGVLSFVNALPERLRRLKTTVGRHVVVSEDELRGPIDWPETITARTRRPGSGNRVFAYGEPEKQFDLQENRVLKRLLSVVDDIVERRIDHAISDPEGYSWAEPWVREEGARRILREALDENPYLERVSNPDEQLPYRVIDDVLGARSSLYREAADLLQYYRQLQRHDLYPEDARNLLRQFFIAPGPESSSIDSDGTEVLFELYWAFKLLEAVPSPRLELIQQSNGNGSIATWQYDDSQYTLYHDCKSPGGVQFEDTPANTVDPPLEFGDTDFFTQRRRLYRVLEEFSTAIGWDVNDKIPKLGSRSRRPDIVVTERDVDSGAITHLFVGEVKYSKDEQYICKGVKQLLETVSLAHLDHDHIANSGDLLDGDGITAALFVDESPLSKNKYPDGLFVFEYGDSPVIRF